MDVFLARQPIFDLNNEVFGYEILYRDSEVNSFNEENEEFATGNALTRTFIDFGTTDLTDNKKAFINFTGEFLKNNVATIFPSDFLVIEILERVEIDEEIIENCKKLKSMGYMLALDDFTYTPAYSELMNIVDIVKIDFKLTPESERAGIIKRFKRKGLSFLAEKVETFDEYRQAVKMGFTYFQGYYFAKPEINKKKKFVPYSENRIRMIQLLNEENPQFDDLTKLIEGDLAFSYDILRLVNSAYFGRIHEITSIRFALVYLGLNEIKKWLYLTFFSNMRQDSNDELTRICILRGKFMENIANMAGHPELSDELLTVGMFSMIDVLMRRPMKDALAELNFSEDICLVLTGKASGFMDTCWQLALKYERAEWEEAAVLSAEIGIPPERLNNAYLDAIKWLKNIKSVLI